MNARAGWIALAVITVVAAVWRAQVAAGMLYPSVDGTNYMFVARSLVRDGVLQFSTFPPGWPLLISIPLLGLGTGDGMDLLRAAQTANVVFGTLTVVLVFALLRPRGTFVALLGAAVFAFLPHALIASTSDLSEASYTAVLLGAWLAWRAERRWSAGALFGFAYLIRPEALGIFGLLVIVRTVRERVLPWRPLATAAAFVVPYLIWVRSVTGEWSLSSKGGFLERAFDDGSIAARWIDNLGTMLGFLPELAGHVVIGLALWGLVRRRGVELIAFLPLLLLPLFTFRMEARYWLPMLPFVLWFAAVGGQDLVARLRSERARVVVAAALSGLALASLTVGATPMAREIGVNHEAFAGMRDAGRWLAENSPEDAEVMGYKPYVAFWSGRQYRKLPELDTAMQIVDHARERGIDYLVVNLALVRSLTPELQPLMAVEPPEPRLARKVELVHLARVEGDPRQTTAIYRIVPVGGS